MNDLKSRNKMLEIENKRLKKDVDQLKTSLKELISIINSS